MPISNAARSEINPLIIHVSDVQQQLPINEWALAVKDHLIGLHLLPPHLNGTNYLRFIQDVLLELLDIINLADFVLT